MNKVWLAGWLAVLAGVVLVAIALPLIWVKPPAAAAMGWIAFVFLTGGLYAVFQTSDVPESVE